ncbi:MAG: hypothetical protein ABS54_07695 [Hyphomicrobium sp. SCN 65-11]|nr:MAG: hypothetical protein ABS54_07695 [Hyphomicrobium sp. SCN 65-11]
MAPQAAQAPSVTHLERLLDVRELKAITTLSKHQIYRLIRARRFPRPLALSPQRVAWRASDVASWMAALPKGGIRTKKAQAASEGSIA